MKGWKLFVKKVPLIGPVLVFFHRAFLEYYPEHVFTYRLKPIIANWCIGILRRFFHFDSLLLKKDCCVVESGSVRFIWNYCDARSLLGFPLQGSFEPIETAIVTALVKTGRVRVAVDVGGNFGWFSCHLLQLLPQGAQLHVFEPEPMTFLELEKNLALNVGAERVTLKVNRACLSDKSEKVDLYVPRKLGPAYASIQKQYYSGEYDKFETEATTLLAYCEKEQIAHIDFIKIDVEGAELKALTGGEALFSGTDKPVVMIEAAPKTASAFGHGVDEVIRFFTSRGYVGFVFVGERGLIRLTPDSLEHGYNFLFIGQQDQSTRDLVEAWVIDETGRN